MAEPDEDRFERRCVVHPERTVSQGWRGPVTCAAGHVVLHWLVVDTTTGKALVRASVKGGFDAPRKRTA